MDERVGNLFKLVDTFFEVYQEWVEDEDTLRVTELLEVTTDQLVEVFETGDIPAQCRNLARAVEELGRQWLAFKTKAANAVTPRDEMPGMAFQKQIRLVMEARQDAKPKQIVMPEPIETLTKQNVSDRQICLIWEWTEADGAPQLWKLREERAEPGKHTKDYVPPSQRRRQLQAQRELEVMQQIHEKTERRLKQRTEPAPEPTKELIQQGLSAKQIAKMKLITVAEVLQVADEHGLERPRLEYDPLESTKGLFDKTPNESGQRILDTLQPAGDADNEDDEDDTEAEAGGPLTLEQEIVEYHKQGKSAVEIAELVSTEAAPVSRQKVQAIVKRFEEEPAAFEPIAQ